MGYATRRRQAVRPRQAAQARAVETANPPAASTPAPSRMVALQQSIGNQAVGRLVQAKLKVGRPGDRFEREADRVADQVSRMPEPKLQRACSCGGDCPKCQVEQAGRELVGLPTKRVQASEPAQIAAPPILHEVLRAPGQPLHPATRAFMEPRFGYDFSGVRVHSGAAAAQSAQGMNANAYTVGRDIAFGAGAYTPGTDRGRRLIAHELTHVVQQSESHGVRIQREAKEGHTRQIRPARLQATPDDVVEIPPEYVGKVPVSDPTEAARIRLRRTRTARFFAKVPDPRLEEAYTTRLQRYLDEGLEANDYWDVEMIEQVIQERAPNAPWHKQAQQDFLAQLQGKLQKQGRQQRLATLSPYWQNQIGALAEQTQGWLGGTRDLARDLLWKWLELQNQGRNPGVIEETIINDIASQFEEVLRAADRANQEYCRKNRPGWIEKFHGDPCEPWFEKSHQRGYHELRIFKLRLRTFRDEDGVPYRSIKFWIEEYMKQYRMLTDPQAQLQSLQAQAVASALGGVASRFGGGTTLAAQRRGAATRGPYPLKARVTPLLRGPQPTPGGGSVPESVGDIVTSPVLAGPQRIVAVKSGGVTVLQPIGPPLHRRALPAASRPTGPTRSERPPPAGGTLALAPKRPGPGARPAGREPAAEPVSRAPTRVGGAVVSNFETYGHKEMLNIFVRTFKRPGPPSEAYHVYPTVAEYHQAWRALPGVDPNDPIPPGFFVPRTRVIHLPPNAETLTVFHEALHWASNNAGFGPHMGQFVNEGMTEWLTQRAFGGQAYRVNYGQNVAFVKLLAGSVGDETLITAFLDGNYQPLYSALETLLGSSDAAERFVGLLRHTPVGGGEGVGKAIDMLTR